jgi:hypothetical protein
VMDVGENPRDRKVAKPRGVGGPQGSSTASLRKTPGRHGRHAARRGAREARRRMARENETGSQGDAADPRGKTQGRTGRSIQDLEVLRPGNEALKRTRSGRMERHQGTAGGQRPGNRHRSGRGKAPKGESRERCARRKLLRKADRDQAVKWVIKPRRRSGGEYGARVKSGRGVHSGSIAPQVLWRRRTS